MSLSRRWIYPFAFIVFCLVPVVGAWAQAQTSSDLQLLHNVTPNEIFVRDAADDSPRTAEVDLSLRAGEGDDLPLDLVLVFDRSATADVDFLHEVGEAFLSTLGRDDRVALVSFAESASVDVELTNSATALRRGLEGLRNQGKTAVGDGLFAATQHLLQRGRDGALWVEVLVTDGRANAGRDPELQAQRAADNGALLFTVGTGRNPAEDLLRTLAEVAGGAFFRSFSFDLVDEVLARTEFTVAARDLLIVETLSAGILYEGASLNPPDAVRADGLRGTRLEWRLDSLDAGEEWRTRYRVSAEQEGVQTLNQSPSELSFEDFRGQRVTQALPTLRFSVRGPRPANARPTADFGFSPEGPSTRDEVQFTDRSSDPDGSLTAWEWDFGDGATSSERSPTHRYARDGRYTVSLTVTDDRDGQQTVTRTITVSTKRLSVVRTIETFLPTDTTLAGETFRVTLEIRANESFNGLGVDENLPEGWTVTTVDNGGARFKPDALQWVFLENVLPEETRTITYDVIVPENAQPGVYNFNGIATSASPQLETKVDGDSQVEIKGSLDVELVLSRWDTQADALDLQLSDEISFEQVQLAVAWWLDGSVVPHSGGKVIDFFTVQRVIARWLTGTPVDEALET